VLKKRRRPAPTKLERCPECGSMSSLIYRCEDGRDRCVVCMIKWYRSKYGTGKTAEEVHHGSRKKEEKREGGGQGLGGWPGSNRPEDGADAGR
jgi:hypothetical protein